MKDLFIVTRNPDLADYLQLLLNELLTEHTWNLKEKFSKNLDLIIFDSETVEFKEFPKYQSETPIILFSYQIKPLLLQFTTKYYVNGIISLDMSKGDVSKTLDTVFENDIFYSDKMISMLFSNTINEQASNVGSLTERENEILVMMMKDLTNEDIANELNVSVRTINAHKGNIMRKVGAKTTSGLIKTAIDFSAVLKTQL